MVPCVSRLASLLVFLLLAAAAFAQSTRSPREHLRLDQVPEHGRRMIERVLEIASRPSRPNAPAGWRPTDPVLAIYKSETATAPDHQRWFVAWGQYMLSADMDWRGVSMVGHTFEGLTEADARAWAVTEEEARARAERFFLDHGVTAPMRTASVERQYGHWLVTLVPTRGGVDYSSLIVRPSLLIDRQDGYVISYRRWAVPPPDGPSTPATRAVDAQTLAGAHLGSASRGASWELTDARLAWVVPFEELLAPTASERTRRLAQEGRAGLFYEVLASDPMSVSRVGGTATSVAIVYVDAVDGRIAFVKPFQALGSRPATPSIKRLPRMAAGPVRVSLGDRSLETYRGAIWWTPAKGVVGTRTMLVASPRAATTVGFDPVTGLVAEARTGFVGIPSPSLRRALESLMETPPTPR